MKKLEREFNESLYTVIEYRKFARCSGESGTRRKMEESRTRLGEMNITTVR
jgi:hypothetical protein